MVLIGDPPRAAPVYGRGSDGGQGSLQCPVPSMRLRATLLAVCTVLLAGCGATYVAERATGFQQPYLGTPRYAELTPKQATEATQINQPLGRGAADSIATAIGMDPAKAFTPEQYQLFMSGGGVGGQQQPVELVKQAVAILSNTAGSPLQVTIGDQPSSIVLGSYGLYVDPQGNLMSAANAAAPTRQVNEVLKPDGYLTQWCSDNGLDTALVALYASPFTREAAYSVLAQKEGGTAQLVTHASESGDTRVGMPMAPSIWITNFALMYMLSPDLAAKLPAYWAPIPEDVAQAIADSPNGQVSYVEWQSAFK